jgi:hypothetical protein
LEEELDLLRYDRAVPGREMLIRHYLGTYVSDRVDALKGILDRDNKLPIDGTLSTVLIEDIDHFGDLIHRSLKEEVVVRPKSHPYWQLATTALGMSTLLLLHRNRAASAKVRRG